MVIYYLIPLTFKGKRRFRDLQLLSEQTFYRLVSGRFERLNAKKNHSNLSGFLLDSKRNQ